MEEQYKHEHYTHTERESASVNRSGGHDLAVDFHCLSPSF